MNSGVITAAAARLERAWALAVKDKAEHLAPTDAEIIEVHEAALALVAVTETDSLQEALQVLRRLDR